MNISIDITTCISGRNSAVIQVDSPTVPTAGIASNSTSSSRWSDTASIVIVVSMTSATVSAYRCTSGASRLPMTCTVGSPLISARMTLNTTARTQSEPARDEQDEQ